MESSSHLLKVGDFVLNTSSRKLFDIKNNEISLSPTLYTLLKCFIDHQNQTLSKEEIITNVWKGKIVVEANVNQNIKKLRDVLGDTASNPKYIETVTGQGFRFIANSDTYKDSPKSDVAVSGKFKLIYLGLFLILIAFLLNLLSTDKKEPSIKALHPLTTLKGIENYPDVTSDKKYLLFSHKLKGSWDVYVKPLDNESYHPILNSENDELFPVISDDQSKLLYFLLGKNECGLYIRDIVLEKLELSEPRPIKICSNSKERIRAEWKNNEEIFISINTDLSSPASIYHFNLNSKQQSLISKPDTKGFGDYAFKYSKANNMLAYIRNIGWSSSEIWLYSLDTGKHNKIKSTPLLLNELDWDEKGWIIYQSGNKEVSRLSIDGLKEEVIAKFVPNSFLPFYIDKERLGVVVGDFVVIDISVYDLQKNKAQILISSSFNDYFASGGGDNIVFVSNRSGDPQVWLRDNQNNDTQITHFTGSFELKWLSIDPNNDLIMFNKSGHTNVIQYSGKVIFNSEDYSSQVHNNPVFDSKKNRFMYSIQYDGEWNIETRSLEKPGERAVLLKGITARPCFESDCVLYFKEKDDTLYRYNAKNNTSEKLIIVDEIRKADEWAVLDEQNILYLDKQNKSNSIVKINVVTGKKDIIHKVNAKSFSLDRDKNVIYTNIVSQGNTDMMYFNR